MSAAVGLGVVAGALVTGVPLWRAWRNAVGEARLWWRLSNLINEESAGRGATWGLDGTEWILVLWPDQVMTDVITPQAAIRMATRAYGLPAASLMHYVDSRGMDIVRPKSEVGWTRRRVKAPEHGE